MTVPMRALPGIAPAGGMAVPALIYAAFKGRPEHSWTQLPGRAAASPARPLAVT